MDPRTLLSTLVISFACAACTLSTGTTTGVMSTGKVGTAGQTFDARFHVAERDGFVAGIGGEVGTPFGSGECCTTNWQALVSAGYAFVPTPASKVIGFDAVGLLGRGRLPSRSGPSEGAWLAGAKLGFPIRVTRRRELWQADDYVGVSPQVTPELTLLGADPSGARDDRVIAEVVLGVTFRMFIYSAILP